MIGDALILAVVLFTFHTTDSYAAGPAKLLDSSQDTGETFVSANVFAFGIERPKTITYRATLSPPAPAEIKGTVNCDRGRREVERDYMQPTSASLTKQVPLTIRKPDECYVDLYLEYADYEQAGTLKLELFATKRKRP